MVFQPVPIPWILQSLNHLCCLALDSLQDIPVYLLLGSPSLNPALQIFITRAEQRRGITSVNLLAVLCLMQSRMPLAFFSVRAQCWLTFNLLPTRTSTSLSANPPSSQSASSLSKHYFLVGRRKQSSSRAAYPGYQTQETWLQLWVVLHVRGPLTHTVPQH